MRDGRGMMLQHRETPLVPEGYLFRDYTGELPGCIAVVNVKGLTQYFDDKLNIQKQGLVGGITTQKIYLPRAKIETVINGISLKNIEAKYKDVCSRMDSIRHIYLNKLKMEKGQGIYVYYCSIFQSIDGKKAAMFCTEEFSAIWSYNRIY